MKKITFLIFSLCLFLSSRSIAQSGVGGSFTIHEDGSFTIFGAHSFEDGGGFIASGMIKTARTGNKGYLNFGAGSSWTGASEEGYVDGYVMVFHNDPFVFPIGHNGKYRPIAISGGAKTMAAYYDESPKEALFAASSSFDQSSNIERISNEEYWEVRGAEPVNITLAWGAASNVPDITSNDLSNLTILGWKDGQWKEVASKTEVNVPSSLIGSTASNDGAISTSTEIIPDDYTYFTLGAKTSATSRTLQVEFIPLSLYPNPVENEMYLNLEDFDSNDGTIKIFNLYGQLIEERTYDSSTDPTKLLFNTSNYMNGMYKVHIKLGYQESIRKFVVNRLY